MDHSKTGVAFLVGITAAIVAVAGVVAQPSISVVLASSQATNSSGTNATGDDSELTTFEEEALGAEEEEGTATTGSYNNGTISSNNTTNGAEGPTMPTQPSIPPSPPPASADDTIVLQGTVSSPGEEAGPFQVVDLLPPALNGTVYTGWVTYTASKPVFVAPLNTYGVADTAINPDFGDLFVFPGIPNSTMIAPAITMPNYTTQEQIGSDIPMPDTFSATVPFSASGLSVGTLDGEPFIVSYTLYATVDTAETVNNVESALIDPTVVEGIMNETTVVATAVSGSAFLNETAYSPNPIEIENDETVTWVNKDFDPHTVTSGGFGGEDVGQEFDSGYMGPQSMFSFTFEEEGEFNYFCAIHPNMVGTVIVD
ncbi:MAG TPA: plastocyanin/azurin family copper-binding protein [Nitrososphaera sp.]